MVSGRCSGGSFRSCVLSGPAGLGRFLGANTESALISTPLRARALIRQAQPTYSVSAATMVITRESSHHPLRNLLPPSAAFNLLHPFGRSSQLYAAANSGNINKPTTDLKIPRDLPPHSAYSHPASLPHPSLIRLIRCSPPAFCCSGDATHPLTRRLFARSILSLPFRVSVSVSVSISGNQPGLAWVRKHNPHLTSTFTLVFFYFPRPLYWPFFYLFPLFIALSIDDTSAYQDNGYNKQ